MGDVKTRVKASGGAGGKAADGGREKRAERAEKGRKRGLKGLRSAKIKIFGILLTDFARKCIIILL